MIKIVDRFITSELLSAFLFGVIAFSAISAGIGILPNLIAEASGYGLSVGTAVALFLTRIPQIMVYTFPTAILLASFQTFGQLSGNSEITAFLASGIGFNRLIRPTLIVGLAVSFLTIFFNEAIVPQANVTSDKIIHIAKNTYQPKILHSVSIPEYENGIIKRSINAQKVENGIMYNVVILEYTDGVLERSTHAKTASFVNGNSWHFNDGITYIFDFINDENITKILFEKKINKITYSQLELNK
jgi:lipopolysaccharide export system permease protein